MLHALQSLQSFESPIQNKDISTNPILSCLLPLTFLASSVHEALHLIICLPGTETDQQLINWPYLQTINFLLWLSLSKLGGSWVLPFPVFSRNLKVLITISFQYNGYIIFWGSFQVANEQKWRNSYLLQTTPLIVPFSRLIRGLFYYKV